MAGVNLEPLLEPALNSLVKVLSDHPQLIESLLQAAALAITAKVQAFIAETQAAAAANAK